MQKRLTTGSLARLGGCFLVSLLFWDWLYPVNVFVVVLHEWSHGAAAILTGGRIEEIYIDPRAGGWCSHVGGWPLAVSAAGYLGSSILGASILVAAAVSRWDRVLSGLLGSFLVYLGIRYVGNAFGRIFCIGFGIFMMVAAHRLSEGFNDFLLRFLGLSSCLYAVVRVRGHLLAHWYGWKTVSTGSAELDRIWSRSDADVLAGMTGIPALGWWGAFLLFGVICVTAALWFSVRNEAGWGRERAAVGWGEISSS